MQYYFVNDDLNFALQNCMISYNYQQIGGRMTGFEIILTIIGLIVLILLVLILRTRLIIYTGRKRDYKVEYVICAAHGIRTDGKWINELFMHLKEKYPVYSDPEKTKLIPLRYGYLLASVCVLGFVKNYLINWMIRKFEAYCEMFPLARIYYFSHSYGTMLGYEALRRSDNIYLEKIILVASIVSSHELFDDTLGVGKVKEINCFCSKEDEVCKYNPFGHSGYWGFLPGDDRNCYKKPYKDLEIYNFCKKDLEHVGYFKDKETISEWLEILDPDAEVTHAPSKNWLCPFIAATEIFPPECVKEICIFYDEENSKCLLLSKFS